jgi:hypothetical protein
LSLLVLGRGRRFCFLRFQPALFLIVRLAICKSPQKIPTLLFRLLVLFKPASTFLDLPLIVLRKVLPIYAAVGTGCHHFERGVSDYNRQTKGEIQHATLAAIF